MKYTKEYYKKNKIVLQIGLDEELRQLACELLGIESLSNLYAGMCINLGTGLHSNEGWYRAHDYIIISKEEFYQHQNINQSYEIY